MPNPSSSTPRVKSPEQPLSGTALTLLVVSGTVVMALFYMGLLLALLLIGLLLALELALLIGLARVGAARLMIPPIQAQVGLAGLILQGLNLKEGPEYHMPLPREEAPRLYALLERVAGRAQVPPPDRVV